MRPMRAFCKWPEAKHETRPGASVRHMLTHCCCMCNGKDLYEAAFELAFPLNASCTLVYAYVLQPFRACLLSTSGQIKQPKQIHGRAFFLSFIGNLSSW
mmetsp:Transcript_3109/g.7139  ORF Transcript_3109/g.7139 Transcript_3109/m.7139 type:complete len:99 (-) Transcript_3109:54-350(-)